MRHQPSDDLLRVFIRSKGLGSASSNRITRARQTFVEAFQTYLNREADSLLNAAKEQLQEGGQPGGDASEEKRERNNEVRTIELGDGMPPLAPGAHARAWRVRGSQWRRETDGRALMLAVIRYLASMHSRGRQRYYDEAVDSYGTPLFPRRDEVQGNWTRVEQGMDRCVYVNLTNKNKEAFLAKACAAVQLPSGSQYGLARRSRCCWTSEKGGAGSRCDGDLPHIPALAVLPAEGGGECRQHGD